MKITGQQASAGVDLFNNKTPTPTPSTQELVWEVWRRRQGRLSSARVARPFFSSPASSQAFLSTGLLHSSPDIYNHRLNMELDLQSLFGLHVYVQQYSLAANPQPPPRI
jgi:hypothetical protein